MNAVPIGNGMHFCFLCLFNQSEDDPLVNSLITKYVEDFWNVIVMLRDTMVTLIQILLLINFYKYLKIVNYISFVLSSRSNIKLIE